MRYILLAAILACAAFCQASEEKETWQEKEAFRLRLAEIKANRVYEMHQQVYENRVSLILLQYQLKHSSEYDSKPRERTGRVRDAYRVRN